MSIIRKQTIKQGLMQVCRSYSQLYDVQTFPTLYLLDKDKRIIAKKLTYQQLDEVLQLKMKGL